MDHISFAGNLDLSSIEELYQQYKNSNETLGSEWKAFFQGYELGETRYEKGSFSEFIDKEFEVIKLIDAYRRRGHLFTKTNPVRTRRTYTPTLELQEFNLSDSDLNTEFEAGKIIGIGKSSLRNIIDYLNVTYCHSIGSEFMYIRHPEKIGWIQKKIEANQNTTKFKPEEKMHFLNLLVKSVGFEKFIHKKFIGQKRFSLEGGEALIPALDSIIERGSELGIEEFVIGMAHRGRLNVLANIMQKPYRDIFNEFNGEYYSEDIALGDVKYHLGYDTVIETQKGKKVTLNLVPNPSHLETVGAVAQGLAKSKIIQSYEENYNKVAPIIIHGDAAVSAQGIVYETAQMSMLNGYKTGGSIHLVVNNQVGFTTNYLEGRSSTYCTDISKVTKSPAFHVNGDDVEALIHTINLAIEYRQQFQTDVYIDILSYRRYGHNEGDEPRFTQPTLYKAISKHSSVDQIYSQQLIDERVLSIDLKKSIEQNFNQHLEEDFEASKKTTEVKIRKFLANVWKGIAYPSAETIENKTNTSISEKQFKVLFEDITRLPEGKDIFKKIEKLTLDRVKMFESDKMDWAIGELMAYASLLSEKHNVRVSGQDSERGTFSHRHAALVVENTDEKYIPLQHLSNEQARFDIHNSLLSEYGVLGFEYGYSINAPNSLTIWEAQFGDFYNVAQVIIDQYISSAEEKWGLLSGLVMLLPHGFEGQGPEHSSARIERFLTLAANYNMRIVQPSTPANFFHLMRLQVKQDSRIPAIVFSPKSLLRHPECVSTLNDFTKGEFLPVIDDIDTKQETVSRIVFCTGKVYYELLKRKQELKAQDIALVRIEQLFPFPEKEIQHILKKYKNAMLHLWVQEEPENMGAWMFFKYHFEKRFKKEHIEPVTRIASGSPAVGLNKLHLIGQNEIIQKVFRKCDCKLKNDYCGLQCVAGRSREEILKQHHYFLID
ncbi:MAG: 2-oxoglutarate dehydrogenase E1 component [Bacteroidales bacterium]|nr:2-oxoglutarate dehydrogenase E1 component [Bacteroidales bacterium]